MSKRNIVFASDALGIFVFRSSFRNHRWYLYFIINHSLLFRYRILNTVIHLKFLFFCTSMFYGKVITFQTTCLWYCYIHIILSWNNLYVIRSQKLRSEWISGRFLVKFLKNNYNLRNDMEKLYYVKLGVMIYRVFH